MSARTTSSAPPAIARRCSQAGSRASARAIARRSKTKSCVSPARTPTRFLSSPKGCTRTKSILTASPPACRTTCSRRSCAPFVVSNRPISRARAMRSNTIFSIRATCSHRCKPKRWQACSLPARSMARQAMKKPRRRAWSLASTPCSTCASANPGFPSAATAIWAC